MKKIIFTGLFFLIIATLSNGCSLQQKSKHNGDLIDSATIKVESKDISVEEFKNQIAQDTNLVILDVRTPQELTGEFPKIETAINIPVQELENRIDELIKYKDKKIAVICRSGRRSKVASDILAANGFNVENVLGGMVKYLSK